MLPPLRLRIPLPALTLLLLLAGYAAADSFSGKVVKVADGDSLYVLRNGKEVKVRLVGIDSPEKGQPFSERAKQFSSDCASDKVVTVHYTQTDQYHRILGKVVLPDGKVLNQELVRAGYAWHYKRYSKDPTLEALEEAARSARWGLWLEAQPTAPWEYRKAKR